MSRKTALGNTVHTSKWWFLHFRNFTFSGHASWVLGLFMTRKCSFTQAKLSFIVPVPFFSSFSIRKKILKNVKKSYVKKNFFSWPNDLVKPKNVLRAMSTYVLKKKFGPKRPFWAYLAALNQFRRHLTSQMPPKFAKCRFNAIWCLDRLQITGYHRN